MLVQRGGWLAWVISGVCACGIYSGQASAKLGGTIDSIERDREAYHGTTHQITGHSGYTVHEVASGGLTLREYADVNGVIFAVAWQGLNQPDLTTILGDFNGEYLSAFKQAPRPHGRRSQSHIESSNIVVEKYGHMRAMSGRAYVPAKLPAAVSLNEIH